MTFPFSLTGGFKQSADNVDLRVTTDLTIEKETVALNLGMGDGVELESSGLIARSNAAVANLNDLRNRKDKDKRFADLVYEQIRKSLEDISVEMDWLDKQIKIEETALQQNNTDIDFIRTLDEDNIMDADGNPRDDVAALLKKHGYDDTDNLALDEIQLILHTIETDLHNDNTERQGRIEGYQERHGHLQESVQRFRENMPEGMSDDIKQKVEALAEREPYEVTFRSEIEAAEVGNADVSETMKNTALENRIESRSTDFDMGMG